MPQFPRRTATTHWWNDEPIADVHEALSLLRKEGSSSDPIHLHLTHEDAFKWEIRSPWYREGSSGADTSGVNYFQIDQDLAEQLRAEGLVERRRIPRWGYTETRETEFVLSASGRLQLERFEAEMREKAKGMLVVGVHTDLTGEIVERGSDRDHRWYGPLHFRFAMPNDAGICRVYPEDERIELPESEVDAA